VSISSHAGGTRDSPPHWWTFLGNVDGLGKKGVTIIVRPHSRSSKTSALTGEVPSGHARCPPPPLAFLRPLGDSGWYWGQWPMSLGSGCVHAASQYFRCTVLLSECSSCTDPNPIIFVFIPRKLIPTPAGGSHRFPRSLHPDLRYSDVNGELLPCRFFGEK